MRSDITRRQVAFDAASGTLTVGGRTTVVDCDPSDNECLLRTYLDLVADQRSVPLGRSIHLRRDDIAVLAELLDLDDDDLEARLQRILHLSEADAADLHRRLLRHRVAAAAVGVGLLAAVPVGSVMAGATEHGGDDDPAIEVQLAPDRLDGPVVVEADDQRDPFVPAPAAKVTPPPQPEPQVTTEPPQPEPEPEPEVSVGYSVTYERDPNFVPEEGVDIGTSMVIERDAP